jgi:hypothetical protein
MQILQTTQRERNMKLIHDHNQKKIINNEKYAKKSMWNDNKKRGLTKFMQLLEKHFIKNTFGNDDKPQSMRRPEIKP